MVAAHAAPAYPGNPVVLGARRDQGPNTNPTETWPRSKTALYGLILPILAAPASVNQRLPSGPVVMDVGTLLLEGIENSVMVPEGVTLPILPALFSVNQRLPSGPVVMSYGPLPLVGVANSVMVPEGVTLPILPTPMPPRPNSVNQRLPSGPVVM